MKNGLVKYLSLICICLFCSCSEDITMLNPDIPLYQNLYGLDFEDEESVTIIQSSDGNFISAGINEAVGTVADSVSDVSVLKISPEGTLLKNLVYNCKDYEDVHSLIQTSDGGYILAGRTRLINPGESDMLVIKLNNDLSVNWSRTYGGPGDDRALSIKQTREGDYIIAGATSSFGAGSSDIIAVKVSSFGNLLWSKTFGFSGFDLAHSVIITDDTNYVISGWVIKPGETSEDVFSVKLSPLGSVLWEKSYGGSFSDLCFSGEQVSSVSMVLCGSTRSFSAGESDAFIMNIRTANGDLNYFNTFGGALRDEGRCIKHTFDGGYVIAGYTFSSGAGDGDAMLLKLNSSGSLQNAFTYGEGQFDIAYGISAPSSGGYVMCGSTILAPSGKTDIRIIRANNTGESCGGRSFLSVMESPHNITPENLSMTETVPPLVVSSPFVSTREFPANITNICRR